MPATPPPPPSALAMDTAPTEPLYQEPISLSWQQPKGLYALSFVNFFLRIITLGIYTFWARTEVRKRIWSGIRVNGQPLQYTGTGAELFKGFVIIFLAVIIPIILVSAVAVAVFGPDSPGQNTVTVLIYLVILFLVGMGIYRAWRYRLSRTKWRGIRAGLAGSDTKYAGRYFWTAFLIPLTLGWIVPWRTTRLQELITDDTRFGSRPFEFSAMARSLYPAFAVLWLGAILAFVGYFYGLLQIIGFDSFLRPGDQPQQGLPQITVMQIVMIYVLLALAYLLYSVFSSWYHARQFNHFAIHTSFESGSFQGSMTGLGLLWIVTTNFFIVFLTLGLLTPIAQARLMRYTIDNLEFVGTAPLHAIAQGADRGPGQGEGLAQAFDIDGF